jgi:YD repeat-containing protein
MAPAAPLRTSYVYDGDWPRFVWSPGNADLQRADADLDGRKCTEYGCDRRGNRIVTKDLQTGGSTTKYFDGNNNVMATVDSLGRRTDQYYDIRNRRVESVLPDGSSVQTLYDGASRVVAIHRPVATVFGYRLDPDAATTQRTTAPDGWLIAPMRRGRRPPKFTTNSAKWPRPRGPSRSRRALTRRWPTSATRLGGSRPSGKT